MLSLLRGDRGGQIVLSVLMVATIVLPLLNMTLPESHAWHISTYQLNLFGKYLCYALLAMSVDLVWGYMGFFDSGSWGFLWPRRLRYGHVSNAASG